MHGGDPPAKAKRRLFKYLKKGNYYLVATNWGGTSNNRLLKTTDLKRKIFQKYHILENTTTNEKNSKFQKMTDLKKQQISKNDRSLMKSYFLNLLLLL